MTQNKISSLAEMRQRGTREQVEIAAERQDWEADDYFTALQDLLSEMRARGLINFFYGVGDTEETELGDVIQMHTKETLSVSRNITQQRELTDEELVAAWGLEEGAVSENEQAQVQKDLKYTREEWESIQAMQKQLTELFDDRDVRTHFRQKHLGEDFKAMKKEQLENIAKRIDLNLNAMYFNR